MVAGAGDEELGDVFLRRFFGRPAEDEGVAGVALDRVGLDAEAAGAVVGGEKIGAANQGSPALTFDRAGVGPDACLVRTVATVYGEVRVRMRDQRVGLYREIGADVALKENEAREVLLVADGGGERRDHPKTTRWISGRRTSGSWPRKGSVP